MPSVFESIRIFNVGYHVGLEKNGGMPPRQGPSQKVPKATIVAIQHVHLHGPDAATAPGAAA